MDINGYLLFCEVEKRLSIKTIKAYETDLSQFKDYIFKQFYLSDLNLVKKNHLREYMVFLKKYSPRTIKRKIASIKAYYNFLEFEEVIIDSPFKKIKLKIKIEKLLPIILSLNEIETILKKLYQLKHSKKNSLEDYNSKIRDIAVIELLFASGLRVSELCSLKYKNITSNFSYIKILGKGKKERLIPITNSKTRDALKIYYDAFKFKIEKKDYFFINRLNNRLSEQSVRFLVKKISETSGVKRDITPHVFRHTFATLLLESDVNIRYIQELLGHSSITITEIYTHVSKKRINEILNLNNPRNSIAEFDNE